MSFLDEFDKRAERKAGDPLPQGESAENKELLDFADLIRERRALPSSSERERVLERVRGAQKPAVAGPGHKTSIWPMFFAAAAMVAVVVGIAIMSKHVEAPTGGEKIAIVKDNKNEELQKNKVPVNLVMGSKSIAANRAPNEEFANLEFPKPQIREGDAKAVETAVGANAARIVRVQGLATFQRKGENRWRVGLKGQTLTIGDTIRVSKRNEACVRILGPDGSAVSLSPGALARYDGPRNWNLLEGSGRFQVAERKDLDPFSVSTPQGTTKALGTVFTLDVAKVENAANGSTLCWVDEGKVSLTNGKNPPVEVAEGKSALIGNNQIQSNDTKYSNIWLASLERMAESDHGIGQLVATAEKANEHMALEVKSHEVTVTVVDQVARTFVDEVFINNTDRRMEGTFYYPLPADASISEFAMYVGETRIVGEVLEQQRARQIFEYIVRQQKDPALLEFAGGNLFKMRVFPIEPHSEKRIQLGYTQILPRSNGKVTYTYPLYSEMLLKNPLLDLKIEFRVLSTPGLSDLASPTHAAPTALSADGKRGALAFRAKKYSPSRDFTVTYSVPDGPECTAIANLRPEDPLGYFMLQLCPKSQLPPRDPPQKLLVIVDGSASSGPQEYAVATEFTSSAAEVSGNWQFGVLRGGQRPQPLGAMAYADANTATNARDFLQKNQPLGATDLLETFRQAAAMIKPGEPIQVVYVGDGIDTMSELSGPALVKEIAALFKGTDAKVSTVAVGSSYDRGILQGISARMGGTFTRVEGAADVHAAVGQVFDSFYRPLLWDVMVNFEEVSVSGVYPEFIGTLAAGDTAIVLGRFDTAKSAKGRVKLLTNLNGAMAERSYDVDFTANEEANRFLPRLWAKAHIDGLLGTMGVGLPADDARTKEQIIQTSTTYQIMSPFTAFLVLESEEDYARFGIKRKLKMWDWNADAAIGHEGRKKKLSKMPQSDAWNARPESNSFSLGAPTPQTGAPFAGEDVLSLGDEAPINGPGEAGGETVAEELLEAKADDGEYDKKANKEMEQLAKDEPADFDRDADVLSDNFETAAMDDERRLEDLSAVEKTRSFHGYFKGGKLQQQQEGLYRGLAGRYERQYRQQFSSLVFQPGTKVEIEIDQPLRPVAYYQRLTVSGKGTLATQLNMCLALEAAGQFEEALKVLAPIIEKSPSNVDLRLEEGSLLFRTGKNDAGKAAFAKAQELAAEKDRASVKARVASLLSSFAQHAEAAEMFAAMARSADKAEQALQNAQSAGGEYAAADKKAMGVQLWEELTKRWSNDAAVTGNAGVFIANYGTFERGVELVKAARKIDPKVNVDLIALYAQKKMRNEAMAEFNEVIAAGDGNRVYLALSGLTALGQNVATDEALKMLAEGHSSAQYIGATQYFQSYSGLRNRAHFEALWAATQRADFPPQARINAFYSIYNARNYARALKIDPSKVIAPLCEKPATKDEWAFAAQGVGALNSYGYYKEALELIEKLKKLDGFNGENRVSIFYAEFGALNSLDRSKEAEQQALKLFDETKDENAANGLISQLFYSRLNRNEFESAAQTIDLFAKRYPDSEFMPQYYVQLLQHLRQNQKKDEAAALIEKLNKTYPENAAYIDMLARQKASQGKFRDAVDTVRKGIEVLSKLPPVPVDTFQERMDEKKDKKAEPGPKEPEEKKAERAALEMQRRKQIAEQRRYQRLNMITLLAQLSAQDAELRVAFLKEAEANAKTEDPAQREWTEAILTCFNSAADVDGNLKKLQALYTSEASDPVWPRRYANALLSGRKLAEAKAVFEKIFEADTRDVESALTLNDLCTRLKDNSGAEKYFNRAFEALCKQPQRMQQFAQMWQSQKPLWSLKAWAWLMENEKSNPSYFAYQAGYVCQQLGREKEGVDYFFRALSLDGGYAESALSQLVALSQQEEYFRPTLARVQKQLEAKPEGSSGVYQNLLLYRLEKIHASTAPNPSQALSPAARKALEAAAEMTLKENDYSTGLQVVGALVEEKMGDRAEKYALEGGGKLSDDARRQLIRNSASNYFNRDKEFSRGIRLMRKIMSENDPNFENDRAQIINFMINAGQLAAAEDEARKLPMNTNSWNVYNAWNNVVSGYQRINQHSRAVDLALEAWKLMKDDTSYSDNAFNQFIWACDVALQNRRPLSVESRKAAIDALREAGKMYFLGESNNSLSLNENGILDRLGLRNEFTAMAREAGASDDPKRVSMAAYYFTVVLQIDEAKRLYRRALPLKDADVRNIYQQIYGICSNLYENRYKPQWAEALEALEKLHELKSYQDMYYLQEKGKCLYGLNRVDEARAAFRKVMEMPQFTRQGFWNMQNLANQFQQHQDWTMAAEAWELAIKSFRRQSRGHIDGGTAAQFYRSCAEAYAKLNEKDKALDSYLRAMSVIPRSDSNYQEILKSALKNVLGGQSLEKAVTEYEKNVAKTGERPHLRIAFAEGYNQAKDVRKMLHHLGIAADLLPKDMQLRQQVIDGYKGLNDNEAALASYRDWAKYDPQNIEIYRGMGDLFESLGRHEDAVLAWATMAEIRPREAEGYRAYAQKLVGIGKADNAAVALRHALRYRPTEFDISKELSDVYVTLKQNNRIADLWTTGETACRKAMEDFSDDPQPWLNLGKFLKAENRKKDAEDLYRQILQRPWPRFQRETYDEAQKRLAELS